jgi:hypothetical protein
MMQVNDPSFMSKLQADLGKLRNKLGIVGLDWMQESPEYQVGARHGLPHACLCQAACHLARPGWPHACMWVQ